MHLREGEQILRIFHHHPTPFIFTILKVIIAVLPFYFLLFLFQDSISARTFFTIALVILLIFAVLVIYLSLIYWLDRLIVTNLRVIYIDYKVLTVRDESEALLDDIQDIQTKEKGLLAALNFFDYGLVRLDTPSSYVTMEFEDAPDPEGIRHYIFGVKGTN